MLNEVKISSIYSFSHPLLDLSCPIFNFCNVLWSRLNPKVGNLEL